MVAVNEAAYPVSVKAGRMTIDDARSHLARQKATLQGMEAMLNRNWHRVTKSKEIEPGI